MNFYPDSPLLYEKGFSIIINDLPSSTETGSVEEPFSMDNSTCYYFDYDQRNHSINMEFPHFHVFYEIMILLSPRAYHFVEGKRYSLLAHDIVLLPPSVLHQSEYLPGPPSDRIIIGFLYPQHPGSFSDGIGEILSVFQSPCPVFRFHPKDQHTLFRKLNEIVDIHLTTPHSHVRSLMVHSKFTEFLFLLYSLRDQNHYTAHMEEGIQEKIYAITNYIHTHYREDISLSLLANTFFISPCYLSHQFKRVTGYTLVQYIQLTRFKNAQYLLHHSQAKITQIAEDTGFSSFSQFNRVFRRFCHMSPTDYRIFSRQNIHPFTEKQPQ